MRLSGTVIDGYATKLGLDQVNCNKEVREGKGYIQSYYYAFSNMPAQLNEEILKASPIGSESNPIISVNKLACEKSEEVCDTITPEFTLSFNYSVKTLEQGYDEATLNFDVVCCQL